MTAHVVLCTYCSLNQAGRIHLMLGLPHVGKAERNPAESLLDPKGTYLLKTQLFVGLLLRQWTHCPSVFLWPGLGAYTGLLGPLLPET